MDKFKRDFNRQQEFKENVKYLKSIFSGPASFEVQKGGFGNLVIQLGLWYACVFAFIFTIIYYFAS